MNGLADMRAMLSQLREKMDALSVRERVLVLFTTLTLVGALWYAVLMEPLARRADESRAQLSALEERISVTNRNLEEQVIQLARGGDEERLQIAVLRGRIDEINAMLGNYAAELVDPGEMARVLEGVLIQQSGLDLVRIRNMAPEALSATDEPDAMTFYRHGLEIEVEGGFAACLEYLDEIEALPWRLYWQALELEVIDYPANRIRIEVSTLSLDREWIGA